MHTGRISEQMEETTRVVAAADQAHLDESLASDEWRRRGILQRLTRTDRRQSRFEARSFSGAPLAEAAS
jgi:hypothetical protein